MHRTLFWFQYMDINFVSVKRVQRSGANWGVDPFAWKEQGFPQSQDYFGRGHFWPINLNSPPSCLRSEWDMFSPSDIPPHPYFSCLWIILAHSLTPNTKMFLRNLILSLWLPRGILESWWKLPHRPLEAFSSHMYISLAPFLVFPGQIRNSLISLSNQKHICHKIIFMWNS